MWLHQVTLLLMLMQMLMTLYGTFQGTPKVKKAFYSMRGSRIQQINASQWGHKRAGWGKCVWVRVLHTMQ